MFIIGEDNNLSSFIEVSKIDTAKMEGGGGNCAMEEVL